MEVYIMDPMINERDLISMKLLHYFITKKNYNPIIVQGVENEIWLENFDKDPKLIRININYIHNDLQFENDLFNHNIKVEGGVMQDICGDLLTSFFKKKRLK